MNPNQMPTERDYVRPTLKEIGRRVKRARQQYDVIAMTNTPEDEVERMCLSIRSQEAEYELRSAESCLRAAIKAGVE